MTDWFLDHVGLLETGWLCPSAQVVTNNAAMNGPNGTVDQAWFSTDWDAFMRSPGMVGPQPSRVIAPHFRASGFTVNEWFFDIFQSNSLRNERPPLLFTHESQVRPVSTPVVGDGIVPYVNPRATDRPPWDLVFPRATGAIGAYVIPRHGSRPRPVPRDWPENRPLPGAVNMGFFDGHVEQVPLDDLWQLYWHKDYVAPEKRPGLQ
jgi:prepilin-type processing-associated H-X9-DG protein